MVKIPDFLCEQPQLNASDRRPMLPHRVIRTLISVPSKIKIIPFLIDFRRLGAHPGTLE